MRPLLALLLASLAACNAASDDTAPDASPFHQGSVDAPADAPRTATEQPVKCVDYTRTITPSSGAPRASVVTYATIAGVHKGDEFLVERCDPFGIYADECPAGSTCTGEPRPPGTRCDVMRSSGEFTDGVLVVTCGVGTAGGYRTIRVTKL